MKYILKKCREIRTGNCNAKPEGICLCNRCRAKTGFLQLDRSAHLEPLQTIHAVVIPKNGCSTRPPFALLDMTGRWTGKK